MSKKQKLSQNKREAIQRVLKSKGKPPLNPKQELFCIEYLRDFNGTQAYIRSGYSANGADVSATRLLGNASIKKRIAELAGEMLAGPLEPERIRIKRELETIAYSKLADYLNPDMSLNKDSLTTHAGAAIKEIGPKGFKMHDKVRALHLLAEITKLSEPGLPAGAVPITGFIVVGNKELENV